MDELKENHRLIGCCGIAMIVGTLMIYLFFWFLGGDSIIAEHPRWMVSKLEWNPPSYVVIAQDDNMERTVSAWSNYTYRLKRMRPLSAKNIAELDRLVKKDKRWRKEKLAHMQSSVEGLPKKS